MSTSSTPDDALLAAVESGALELALHQADPGSLAAATLMRKKFPPAVAAAALDQAALRRKAVPKFGAEAHELFFTADGLEQATRPQVAAHRAQRLAASGCRAVVDLGCGIGADSMAFARTGLQVTAVELDPLTATVARLNLAALGVPVIQDDAQAAAADLLDTGDRRGAGPQDNTDQPGHPIPPGPAVAAFCDPARRGARGRTWDINQFTPPWEFVQSLLAGPACLKLGPGVPLTLIPDDVEAVFVSHRGDLVEASVWSRRAGGVPGRAAELLTDDGSVHRLVVGPDPSRVADQVPAVGQIIAEPDPAVLRAGATDTLAERLGATRVADRVGYLLGANLDPTPFARRFEVIEVLAWKEKAVRAWVRGNQIGVLEIKKRGLEFDPAVLRKKLLGAKGHGDQAATLVVTPTIDGARALVVQPLR